jgi:hypothetical protein
MGWSNYEEPFNALGVKVVAEEGRDIYVRCMPSD